MAQQDEALELLASSTLEPLGLMPRASNGTVLCRLGKTDRYAVYKPRAGERPLWDFPEGTLCLREHAAYVVSEASGWGLVPPTVLREGPYGFGAAQLFIDHEPNEHYLTLADGREDLFRRVSAFDLAINNADRKSGHCLLEKEGGRVWMIDHGVTFHQDLKIRTVIWDFEGEPLGQDVVAGLERLRDDRMLSGELALRFSSEEVDAFAERVVALLGLGVFPEPHSERSFPWPPI